MYTIYDTVAEAIAANAAEALARNCDSSHTTEWFLRVNHPTNGQAALQNFGPVTTEQFTAWLDAE